jgi:hypothetical protein
MTQIFDLEEVRSEQSMEISVGEVLGIKALKGLRLKYWLFKGEQSNQKRAAGLVEDEEFVQLIDFGVEELCRAVAWWNMAVGGEIVALDPEVVQERVPVPIQEYVGMAIRKHRNPERKGRRH